MSSKLKKLMTVLLSVCVMVAFSSVAAFAEAEKDDAEIATDSTTTLEDGEYTSEDFQFETNATGKVSFGCDKLIVEGGKVSAVFTSSSANTTHFYMGFADPPNGEITALYDPETEAMGEKVFKVENQQATVPVDLNGTFHFTARTSSKMGNKWIRYTYKISIPEPEWKPTQNQDKFTGISYSLGMISAAQKGTSIVVNDDNSITLNVTTKPMTSQKYIKIAMSNEDFEPKDAETIAKNLDVKVETAKDNYSYKGVDYGIRPYHWSVFSYTIPYEMLGKPIHVMVKNTLRKVDDKTKTYEEYEGDWAYKSTWTVKPDCTPDVELLVAKMSAIEELDKIDISKYDGDELEKVKKAIEDAKASIKNATELSSVSSVINAAKDEVSKVKTTAQKAADKAAKAKADKEKADKAAKAKADKIKKEQNKIKNIALAKVKVKKGKKKITVKWKKNTKFAGYQIMVVEQKTMKPVKTLKVSVKAKKKVIKGLKKKTKYTVTIRGYKTVEKTDIFGKATTKTVKVK